MATTPDYTTLISALIADGWTTPFSAPPRPGALTARILTSPTEHVRLRLITTGASTLALLEPACAPHCENAEHAWQVRAEDPHPTVYIAAARAAHQHAVTDLDGPNLAAALYQHGWYTESDDPTTHSGRYTLATLDGTRRAAYLPGHDAPARYEITLPAATPTPRRSPPPQPPPTGSSPPWPWPPSPASRIPRPVSTTMKMSTTRPEPTGHARSSSATPTATSPSMATATSISNTASPLNRRCGTCSC